MISRRDVLRVLGLAGATAATSDVRAAERVEGRPDHEPTVRRAGQDQSTSSRVALESLTADEAALLTAIVGRLIPSDASGPGAVEAGAVVYIDRALAGALSSSREAYRRGLAALERYARSSRSAPFRELAQTDQDSVLVDVETGAATGSGAGFDGSSAAFFAMVKAHTWQGTFGDPYYGGNRNFIGWDLLGYPGVRTAASPDDQRLGATPTPLRRSAYDSDMFNKA
jgi:gluconate 2-dehydrogenase gamma chain